MTADSTNKKKLLELAWRKFFIYDHNALRHQKRHFQTILLILLLNVIGTILVVLKSSLSDHLIKSIFNYYNQFIELTVLLIPVTSAFLYAVINRFSPGNKWMHLRSSAEEIRSAIFRYRTKVNLSDKKTTANKNETELANTLKSISNKLMETQVNASALYPSKTNLSQHSLTYLTTKEYITRRIDDQLLFYSKRTVRLEQQIKWLYLLIYFLGGLGTILAAIKFQLWIAVTTSISAALLTWLELNQTENNLIIFNQTSEELITIKCWWESLTEKQKEEPRNILRLIGSTEDALKGERSSWLRNTRFALSDISSLQRDKEHSNQASSPSEIQDARVS